MDAVQDCLFGETPRRVGTPAQHWVYVPEQIDFFIESINGRRNAYSTLCWWDLQTGKICDKVLYDFDSPEKNDVDDGVDWDLEVFQDRTDDERIDMMRRDPDLAHQVLGPVVDEVRELADRSLNDNVPILGVFSGFGVHVHQLYEPKLNPETAMATTAYRYIQTLDLQTPDHAIIGQPERICRIPNCHRTTYPGDRGIILDGRECGLVTIPLTGSEMASLEVEWLLDESDSPRQVEPPEATERPEMRIWEDYKTGVEETADVPPRPLNPEKTDFGGEDDLRWLLEQLLRMPCMVERLLDDPNPDHKVRVNATVMLLNVGLSPDAVVDLFSRINWIDFDRETTRKKVKHIYRTGYSDMACQTLRSNGLCTRSEEPKECPTFGWSGGKPEWTQ